MTKTLDTPYVYYELQDDLLIGTYKKGLKINLDIAKEIVKTRLEFIDYKPKLTLALNQGVMSMDKKARDYLSSDEGIRGAIAGAIVLDTPFGSFLGNFYLSVTKPKIPLRIFSKKETAVKWLQQFRK
ncbi:MAG TPA: hypothetical protein VF487_16325 [Chitinophagaceae bacterium]